MGFTAINAPGTRQSHNPMAAQNAEIVPTIATANITAPEQYWKAATVSEYLGRGDPDGMNAEVRGALHGPIATTTGRKGRKRGSIASDSESSKRRRSGGVSDEMLITTSTLRTTRSMAKATNESESESTANPSNKYLSAKMKSQATEAQFEETTMSDARLSQSVSVLTPPTSMECIHNNTQQSSLHAVRSSMGYGTTIYHSAQHNVNSRTGVPQSWSSQPAATIDETNNKSKVQDLGPARFKFAPKFRLPSMDEDGKDPSFDTLLEQISSGQNLPKSKRKKSSTGMTDPLSTKARNQPSDYETTSNVDEDFIACDDDGDMAALADLIDSDGTRGQMEPKISTPSKRSMPYQRCTISNSATQSQSGITRIKKRQSQEQSPISEDELIVLDDEHFADILDQTEVAEERAPTPSARKRSQNICEVDAHKECADAFLTDAERQLLDSLKAKSQNDIKPIVRTPFPPPVRDRSQIFGASSIALLRTCFRLGEALNAGSQAVRTKQDAILEIYARVTSSWREPKPGRKQHFVFKDLYHDRPPHLEGSFELWSQSRLWEHDSKVFLVPMEDGRMCRVITKMKREEQKWRLEVLSIWECDWEDVEFVAGIYGKGGE